jgi:hypothetical protein
MAYKTNKRGRPKEDTKYRDMDSMTPDGFKLDKIDTKNNKIIYKRK